jgi:Domain of unknown function (DUF4499)
MQASTASTDEKNKETDEGRNIVDFLNEERPEALLLLSWNLFHKKDATKAVMVGVDGDGFVMNNSFPGSKPTEPSAYAFPEGPQTDQKVIKRMIGKLLVRNSGASLPPGAATAIMTLLWLIQIAGAAGDADLEKYPILATLQPYALMFYQQRIYAMYSIILMVIAHAFEALYVCYLCNVMGMTGTSNVTWVALTLFMGFPTTTQVMLLAKTAKRKKLRLD